jgi:hypothetical protein
MGASPERSERRDPDLVWPVAPGVAGTTPAGRGRTASGPRRRQTDWAPQTTPTWRGVFHDRSFLDSSGHPRGVARPLDGGNCHPRRQRLRGCGPRAGLETPTHRKGKHVAFGPGRGTHAVGVSTRLIAARVCRCAATGPGTDRKRHPVNSTSRRPVGKPAMRPAFFPYHGSPQSWPKMMRSPNMLYLSQRRARN